MCNVDMAKVQKATSMVLLSNSKSETSCYTDSKLSMAGLILDTKLAGTCLGLCEL